MALFGSKNKNNKKGGMLARLTRLSVLPVVVVALILAIVSTGFVITVYDNNYKDEAVALAHAYSTATRNVVSNLSQQFDVVTENPDIVNADLSMEDRKAILNNRASTSTFKDFSIAYADGKTYNDTDISQRDYFINAMANKGAYMSSPVLRMTDNSLTIMMGKYFNANGTDYLVYGGLSTDTLNDIIKDVSFGTGGLAFIVDKDGMIIASSNDEMVPLMTKLGDKENLDASISGLAPLSEKMLTYTEGTDKVDIKGNNYFVGYTPIEGAEGWSIAIATSWSSVVSSIMVTAVFIILIALVTSVIVVFVVRFFAKRIAKPVSDTAERLTSFANGDISSPAPTTDLGGELGDMTNAMSTMISVLTECIGDIRHVLTSMADGDLTVKPRVEYRGELSEIKTSLDLISNEFNRAISEVSRSAVEVKEGANQLAEGSTQLSENAVTQAGAVEQITTTILDIAKKSEDNAENVEHALETVRATNVHAEDGSHSMNEMLEAIGEIESSSKEIEQIMKVIDDIAFQTNILALNAAIEAARAGEAGKGFAVVADEVRNLAGKSADAAKQTGELINRSIEAVNRGSELAGVASGALDNIVNGVSDISAVMTDIAQANREQTAAVEMITSSMENVNAAIHTTTATAEESAAASEQLSALAVTLSDEVSHFRTTM